MKGDKKIIGFLNKVLKNELVAINQYFLHARMFGDWGLKELEEHEFNESVDEMKHADALTKRILFLEGLPNMQDLGKLRIGETVPEMLANDLALERDAHKTLVDAIGASEAAGDYASRELFAEILESEEEHIDWLETQIALIDKVGLHNYLQSKM